MPLSILIGNFIIETNKSNTALTVTPINLKGSNNSQTIGYRSNARNAIGQLIISKIIHRMNVAIIFSKVKKWNLSYDVYGRIFVQYEISNKKNLQEYNSLEV